jgi:hypothetical protein
MTDEAEGLDFGDEEPASGPAPFPDPGPAQRQQYEPRNRPTHRLSVKERNGKNSTIIGVGWMDQDGTVAIKLNPCIVLSSKDDVLIRLFPSNRPY